MSVVRVVCAHDCPDMCSLLAHVEDGKLVRITGDPKQPYTAGYACAKVNRDAELVHSPERIATPLRRTGVKGGRSFTSISWDEALDEIVDKWKAIIAKFGPPALLGYAYSAHQGQINRGVPLGLFHALGSSRLIAGTVCDTCCETAWDMTLGPVGGVDPETIDDSDLIISWGCDLTAVNVHLWTRIEQLRRKRPIMLICIDPRRSRTAERCDWHISIRIGTDAALALGVMHVLVRDGLCDDAYLKERTLGFDKLKADVLPRFTPVRTAEITGLAVTAPARIPVVRGGKKEAEEPRDRLARTFVTELASDPVEKREPVTERADHLLCRWLFRISPHVPPSHATRPRGNTRLVLRVAQRPDNRLQLP